MFALFYLFYIYILYHCCYFLLHVTNYIAFSIRVTGIFQVVIITVSNAMRKIIFFILTALFFSGCSKNHEEEKYNRIVADLKGKYKPFMIRSDLPVDINGDGVKSMDLLSEIENLNRSEFHLRVSGQSLMFYLLYWQEPFFISKSTGDRLDPLTVTYSKDLRIDYADQPTAGRFEVNDSFSKITFTPDAGPLFMTNVTPDIAEIKGDGIVIVSFTRKIFTTDGWQDLKITGRYRRYYNSH